MRCIFLSLATLLVNPSTLLAAQARSMGSAALQMTWALLIVIGLILVIYAIARKRLGLGTTSQGTIKIKEIRHLQPKTSLALVEVRGRELLLGIGGGRIELLADLGRQNQTDFDKIMDSQQ